MRAAGLAHNTVATYLRVFNTFLRWCQREGLSEITIPNLKEKDTVKETYTDRELSILLARPSKDCDFCEYRNWVIINYILNSGCRAATIRNIQNRDVDLETRQVVYRHTKNGRIQVSPLCSDGHNSGRVYGYQKGKARGLFVLQSVWGNADRERPAACCGSLQ